MTADGGTCSAVITAAAHYLPEKVVTNADLSQFVETSDEWIRSRTGIGERRFLEGRPTSFMAIEVARQILDQKQLDPTDIDLIIVATVTPDMFFPSTACLVQHEIGASKAWAYDLSAACSGFVYAVVAGSQCIRSGVHDKVLVIGADKMSAILDMEDRNTSVLFGDGAGGVLLERSEEADTGLLDFELHADGSGTECLHIKAGGSLHPATRETVDDRLHYVHQDGRTVFKFAVRKMSEVSLSLMNRNNLTAEDLKLFIPHQANQRIIDATAERMNLPAEKVFSNIERYANTTAATIPIAISEAKQQGRLETGDLTLLAAVGGGLTWGAALIRWCY